MKLIRKIFLAESALEPMAEFRKLTASLLTPTTKSIIAKIIKAISIKMYISPMIYFKCMKDKFISN